MGWANTTAMDNSTKKETVAPPRKAGPKKARDPEWASGLKQLYDSVVDEPLPDSFKDLLSRLDESEK